MKIPKEVKELPWPEEYEADGNQHFRMHVRFLNANHERLLIVTFCRNRKNKKLKAASDFRYVLFKKQPTALCLFKGSNTRRKKDLCAALNTWGCYLGCCYPEIDGADERKLSIFLGRSMENTTNHMIPELEQWIAKAMKEEHQRDRVARGEIMDVDVDLCPTELPEGMERFLRLQVLPNDKTLIYKKGNVRGTCFCCRQKVRAHMQRFMHNSVTRCPNCGSIITCYLATSDVFKVDYVQNIVSVQKGTDRETVFIRLWHLRRDMEARWDDVASYLEEVCRWAIRGNKIAKWQREAKDNWYMKCTRYDLGRWYRMQNPSVIYDGDYLFYTPMNQEEIFQGTSLCYCDIEDYMTHDARRNKNPVRFLLDFPRYPMVEKLWKAGYTELVYEKTMGLQQTHIKTIKWTAPSIAKSIAFPKHLLKLMKPEQWTMNYMERVTRGWDYARKGLLKERDILDWVKSEIQMDNLSDALEFTSVHKIVKYLGHLVASEEEEHQRKKAEYEARGQHYYGRPNKDFSDTYRDYIRECITLNLDLRKQDILFPKNLIAAHARTTAQVKYKIDNEKQQMFQITCEKSKWMEWENGNFLIRLPMDGKEIIAEGQYLHHCVGGYIDRMAEGKTMILFIREKKDPERPFYTLEFLNHKVQQCRTTSNRSYTENKDVVEFVQKWLEQIPKLKKKKSIKESAA